MPSAQGHLRADGLAFRSLKFAMLFLESVAIGPLAGDQPDFGLGDFEGLLAVCSGANGRVHDHLRDLGNLVNVLVAMLLTQGRNDARLVFVRSSGSNCEAIGSWLFRKA